MSRLWLIAFVVACGGSGDKAADDTTVAQRQSSLRSAEGDRDAEQSYDEGYDDDGYEDDGYDDEEDKAHASQPKQRRTLSASKQTRPRLSAGQRFAKAVRTIATDMGAPIKVTDELVRSRCSGLTGPGCGAATLALEVAKGLAPMVARRYRVDVADVLQVVKRAVETHSVWHDAYGYVYSRVRKGPGYAYAGCLLSPCDPANPLSGQADGILYQIGRELGASTGPECGPTCGLPETL